MPAGDRLGEAPHAWLDELREDVTKRSGRPPYADAVTLRRHTVITGAALSALSLTARAGMCRTGHGDGC